MSLRSVKIIIILAVTALIIGCFIGYRGKSFPKQKSLAKKEKKKVSKEIPVYKDSSITIAAGEHYKKGYFHQLIFGKLYRDIWILPVEMPLFDIKTEKGGMDILKRGGNMQTLSVHLKANDGRRYVLRTVDKDQSQTLPKIWQKTFCAYIMRDETASLHPYGALVLPQLADAVGLVHTNPKLFFVPYDPNFKKYANLFEGRVVILEEFPDKTWLHTKQFGFPDSILSSEEMLAKRYARQNVVFDQDTYARARLFDLWINDWDRHTGQWKWAEFDNNGKTIFKPIPRDRDITFFRFDSGLIPFIALKFNAKFQSFNEDYNIRDMVLNTFYIDHVILNDMTENDFVKIAEEYKARLTDSVITEAIKTWPKEVYELNGARTIDILKTRREKLTEAARGFYKETFTKIRIIGTDQNEKFIIDRVNDHLTAVKVFNSNDSLLMEHVYDNSVTKELYVFGLNGNDLFIINGNVKEGIPLFIHGGVGNDILKDNSTVKGASRKTKVIDTSDGITIESAGEVDDKTSNNPEVLEFDRVGIKKKE